MAKWSRSHDARKVTDRLAQFNIDVSIEDLYDIEVCCGHFFPNHIISVINKCLSGKNLVHKIDRAQDRGWGYFRDPIYSLLLKRRQAQQTDHIDMDELPEFDWGVIVFSIVSLAFRNDLNRKEVNRILTELPAYFNTREQLLDCLRICKENKARTVAYLCAVAERKHAERRAQMSDVTRDQNEVWKSDSEIIGVDWAAGEDWTAIVKEIKIEQRFKDLEKDNK